MAVDATVPVLLSLGLLLAAIIAGRLVERRLTAAVVARSRAWRAAARSLRCPRVVLLDDAGHSVRVTA